MGSDFALFSAFGWFDWNQRKYGALVKVAVHYKVTNCSQEIQMDTTTLVVIILVLVLLGGGGFYGRGRWY